MKWSKTVACSVILLCSLFIFVSTFAYAQTDPDNGQQLIASDTIDDSNGFSSASQVSKEASSVAGSSEGYTENSDTRSLEKSIEVFNEQFCPPETAINEINDFTLIKLIKAELIKRADMQRYKDMVFVDGKVFLKEKKVEEEPVDKPKKPKPMGKAGKNLTGSFEAACEQLGKKKTRGKSAGTKKPERILKLKPRKIIFRDREGNLRNMEMYSPPKFPSKKKKLLGKRGKKIRDYATSIMVPKNEDGEKSDLTAFDDMPSADAWLDEGEGPAQK